MSRNALQIETRSCPSTSPRGNLRALRAMQLGVGIDAAGMRASISRSSSAVTRSVFVEQDHVGEMRSGSWPRGASRRPVRAAIWHPPPSRPRRVSLFLPTFSSTKKVCATGAGSARPVVSTMMAFEFALAPASARRCDADEGRRATVQQMHPFVISNTSSSAPTMRSFVDADISPELIDDGRRISILAVRLGQGMRV